MNTDKNKKTPRVYTTSIIVFLVIIGGTASALFIPSSPFAINKPSEVRPENTPDYNSPTNEQVKAGSDAKQDFINQHENGNIEQGSVNLTITSSTQNTGVLNIRVMIDTTRGNGECTLTMSRASEQDIKQSATTQQVGSYSVCKGFDIPVESIAKGEWQINIEYKDDNATAKTQKSVTIQ